MIIKVIIVHIINVLYGFKYHKGLLILKVKLIDSMIIWEILFQHDVHFVTNIFYLLNNDLLEIDCIKLSLNQHKWKVNNMIK